MSEHEPKTYTIEEAEAKPDSLYGLNPEDIGYPEDFNAYQAQKKRMLKILKSIDTQVEQMKEMCILYDTFGEPGRAAVVELLMTSLLEFKQCLIQFYVEKM